MKHLKKYNEDVESEPQDDIRDIRVKDIISFLEKFDPETKVYLDKDGWEARGAGISKDDVIRCLIDDSPITHGNDDYLMINN